jgi:hypothetical protein
MTTTNDRLRVPCDPADDCAPGEHKHRCKCGTCWKHNADDFEGSREFDVAHTCPGCGREVRTKYYGECDCDDEPVSFDDLRRVLRKMMNERMN